MSRMTAEFRAADNTVRSSVYSSIYMTIINLGCHMRAAFHQGCLYMSMCKGAYMYVCTIKRYAVMHIINYKAANLSHICSFYSIFFIFMFCRFLFYLCSQSIYSFFSYFKYSLLQLSKYNKNIHNMYVMCVCHGHHIKVLNFHSAGLNAGHQMSPTS